MQVLTCHLKLKFCARKLQKLTSTNFPQKTILLNFEKLPTMFFPDYLIKHVSNPLEFTILADIKYLEVSLSVAFNVHRN